MQLAHHACFADHGLQIYPGRVLAAVMLGKRFVALIERFLGGCGVHLLKQEDSTFMFSPDVHHPSNAFTHCQPL